VAAEQSGAANRFNGSTIWRFNSNLTDDQCIFSENGKWETGNVAAKPQIDLTIARFNSNLTGDGRLMLFW